MKTAVNQSRAEPWPTFVGGWACRRDAARPAQRWALQRVLLQLLIHHLARQSHVDARRRQTLVAERLPDHIELGPLLDMMGGEGVAQGMGRGVGDAGFLEV